MATRRRQRDGDSWPVRVGQLRPSQLMWAFGIGAVLDLPNVAVIVEGLHRWQEDWCEPVGEGRLLRAVRTRLGHQVDRLRMPPVPPDGGGRYDPFSDEARIGLSVTPFPRWLRCPKCGLLGPTDTRLFELEEHLFRPDRVRYKHTTCSKRGKPPTAVPSRFLVGCEAGHLDDFPWSYFVHRGPADCKGPFKFYEVGASLETANLWVKCESCDDVPDRSMIEAFGEAGEESLPACRGHHPHLEEYEDCDRSLRTILLGASNTWFPVTMSVLSVPSRASELAQLVDDHWGTLREVTSPEVLRAFRNTGQLLQFAAYSDDEIWEAIEDRRQEAREGTFGSDEDEVDLKGPEWDVFVGSDGRAESQDFKVTEEAPPGEYASRIHSVGLVERLREVNALLGFTRIEPLDQISEDSGVDPAPLVPGGRPSWVPATEVRGEGIFIRFDEGALNTWLEQGGVQERRDLLRAGHREWRRARRLDPPGADFPGVAFSMIHTLSHVLMRELALECGYNRASIRERVYASAPGDDRDMAGLLIYTAAPDSEGTLGGLVRLGRREELERLLTQALERAELCSSDPLCAEHEPEHDRSLHGAACHACLFAPETSCEFGNRYLDRSLLVPTFRSSGAAYFGPEET